MLGRSVTVELAAHAANDADAVTDRFIHPRATPLASLVSEVDAVVASIIHGVASS
jgi:hypothetical protein